MCNCYTKDGGDYKTVTAPPFAIYTDRKWFAHRRFCGMQAKESKMRRINFMASARGRFLMTAAAVAFLAWSAGARADSADRAGAKFLVCPETVAPVNCDASSAVAMIAVPPAAKAVGCGVQSGKILADAGIPMPEGQYVKVPCERSAAQTGDGRARLIPPGPDTGPFAPRW
jgi:hypothetical protein